MKICTHCGRCEICARQQPKLQQAAQPPWLTAERLHAAVRQQELSLLYQPTLDLASGRIDNVEALLRWNHPEHGALLPAGFIPLAERSGAMVGIGAWVLDTALHQLRRWRLAGLELCSLSVNVSAVQLRSPDFVLQLEQALQQHQIEPERLILDVCSSSLQCECEPTSTLLADLADLGVGMSLDDFGVGRSSLSRLQQLPVREIKIDASLVRDIERCPNARKMAAALIALGKALGLRVVGEGVETIGQQALLAEMDCDAIQGFRIGHACTPALIAPLIAHYANRQSRVEDIFGL